MSTSRFTPVAGTLSDSQRVGRVLFGAALLATTMFAPVTPLGLYAIGALIAIIPLVTAAVGVCPVQALVSKKPALGNDAELSIAAQVELGLIGAVLVGTVYVVPYEHLGAFSVFALMGVFPLTVALMGVDPIASARAKQPAGTHGTYLDLDSKSAESAAVHDLGKSDRAATDAASESKKTSKTRAA